MTALASSRLDREHSAGLLHRLDTIEHEVHQYLLQLHPVRRDFGKIGGKVRTNRNGILVGFAPQQQDHFADDFIHRDQLSLGRGLLIQRPQTVDDVRCKGARLDDPFRPFAHLRQIRLVAVKPSQAALALAVATVIGCANSCEMEATSSPSMLTRLVCARSACSCSARLRS